MRKQEHKYVGGNVNWHSGSAADYAVCSRAGDENTLNPAMPFLGIHHGMCTRRQVQGCLLLWQGKKKGGR